MKKISDALQPELQEIFDRIWDKFTVLFPEMLMFPKPKIIFSNRMKSTAGICYVDKNEIRICTKLFIDNKQSFIDDTIPHEAAHQVDFNINQYDWQNSKVPWHGRNWQIIMLKYGIEPNRCHDYIVTK